MVGDVGIPVTPNREGIPPLLPLSGRCIQHSLVLLADSGRREAHSRGGKGVLEHACPGNAPNIILADSGDDLVVKCLPDSRSAILQRILALLDCRSSAEWRGSMR